MNRTGYFKIADPPKKIQSSLAEDVGDDVPEAESRFLEQVHLHIEQHYYFNPFSCGSQT